MREELLLNLCSFILHDILTKGAEWRWLSKDSMLGRKCSSAAVESNRSRYIGLDWELQRQGRLASEIRVLMAHEEISRQLQGCPSKSWQSGSHWDSCVFIRV
jgi:hypothetical protein